MARSRRPSRPAAAELEIPLRRRDVPRWDAGQLELARLEGGLFHDGPRGTDPRQGNCLDCYLMAALGAVARSRPQVIEDMVRERPGGRYAVRFFERLPGRRFEPRQVEVDDRFLVDRAGQPVYARVVPDTHGRRELWPLVVEKAYARWKGGFHLMGEGGLVEDTLEELTGEPSRLFYVARTEPELLWRTLQRATAEHWPATVCTYGNKARPDLEEFGFHPWHIHIFLGCHVWEGRRIVWLRDPFDRPPAGTRNLPDPDGVFTLAWEDFRAYFAEAIVNASAALELESPPWPSTTIRQALDRSYVFRGLDRATLRELAEDFTRVAVEEGRHVFRVGDPADAYYLIQSGTARVEAPGPKGRRRHVGVLDAGDQLGELSLLDQTPRAEDVRALTDLRLYRLSRAQFERWLLEVPELAHRFRRRAEFQRWMQRWTDRPVTSVSLDGLLAAGTERAVPRLAHVVREGEPAESFFIVLAGECEVFHERPGGRRRTLERLGPGALFGETAARQGVSRSASVRALTAARLLEIDMRAAASAIDDFGMLQRQLEFVADQRARRQPRR